jgi:hypothetical protein
VSITQYVEEHRGEIYLDVYTTNLIGFDFDTYQSQALTFQSQILGINWVAYDNPNLYIDKYEYDGRQTLY